jgi:riboflavin kinase/FMN adenylyltransferase
MQKNRKIVTTGTFDGVHRGHCKVLDFMKERGVVLGLAPVVVTFDRHPLEVIAPERAPKLLMSPDDRDAALSALGVKVLRLGFDESLRRLTAAEWLRRMRQADVEVVVVGYDNTFGCDGRSLGLEDYFRLGREENVAVEEAPVLQGVSSTLVREALAGGRVEEAARMLGRPYTVAGAVVHGRHLGRELGFPTANVDHDIRMVLPASGVYAAEVAMPDGTLRIAVVNVGTRPTVSNGNDISLEAHIPDFRGDLYGKDVSVRFIRRIRDERKFGSADELRGAIRADIEALRKIQ